MAYSPEVKDYVKQLFLTISKDGTHKYGEDDIVDEISKKFPKLPKFPDRRTVNNWINTKDKKTGKSFKDLWDNGVRHGIQNAVREHEVEVSGEEEMDIEIDKIISLRAGNAILVHKKISKKLQKNKDLTKEDLGMWRESERTFNNLNLEKNGTEIDQVEIDYDYLDEVDEDDLDEAD